MSYMTPAFLKRMNSGLDLSGVSDEQIARVLDVASSTVNRVTAAPTHPVPHDFRGGSVTLEQHTWDLGNNYRHGSDRVYLYHRPVKSVTEFTLRVTGSQTVSFDPADIYVNGNDGYIEIISLARRLSVFSAGFVPVIGLRQPVAELEYTYGWTFPVVRDRLYADETLTTFAGSHQWWDATAPVRVYLDGVEQNPANYAVDHDEGIIQFAGQIFDGKGVTADYTHRLPAEIRDAMRLLYVNISEAARMVSSGLTSVKQIKVEEAMLAYSDSKRTVLEQFVDPRVETLLAPYRFRSWA